MQGKLTWATLMLSMATQMYTHDQFNELVCGEIFIHENI